MTQTVPQTPTGTPAATTHAPRRRGSDGLWLIGALVVVAAVIAGCAVLGTWLASGPTPQQKSEAAAQKLLKDAKVTVSQPATLNGQQPNNDPTLAAQAATVAGAQKSATKNVTNSVSHYYGQTPFIELMSAVTAPIANPKAYLDQSIAGVKAQAGIQTMTEVDAGPLGGYAECGDGSISGTPVAICAWADYGSSGLVAYYDDSASAVAARFLAARASIEHSTAVQSSASPTH